MAIILQMTYQKKLGLPNYSSHTCAVTLTVEIPDVSVAAQESSKLYALLQTAVDNEIQEVGFMPDATTYGMINRQTNGNGNAGNGNGHSGNGNGNHRTAAPASNNDDRWNCTDGQRGFILRIIAESKLNKQDVEEQSLQLFGVGVKALDKMQASQLIEELLEKTGKQNGNGQRRWSRQPARA
jgi:hypothetical protein